jgi:hypothetical protein
MHGYCNGDQCGNNEYHIEPTAPHGASFSKPHNLSGANFGDAPTAAVGVIAVAILVAYVTIARPDIQSPSNECLDSKSP